MRPKTYEALKDKQRGLRDGFPQALTLRVHRALSWLCRAEAEETDDDAAFIFYWIAFNAAYAQEGRAPITAASTERSRFQAYFDTVVDLDDRQRVYQAIWSQFSNSIRLLLDNRFVFEPFWRAQHGHDLSESWETSFRQSKTATNKALQSRDTPVILSILFDRLYVLRNQLMHGGATWNSGVNRDQVRDGCAILGFLVPIFIDLMMDNPDMEWSDPHYPVVE